MGDNEVFHGQFIKAIYRSDIEDSIKQKTLYKNYEYFDDFSYGKSDRMGLLIKHIKGKVNIFFFQPDGPKEESILRKLLEWRKSGISTEVGHQGGGNKRNIYGFNSSRAYIISNIGGGKILWCETKPNKILDLANSDIKEDEFRSRIDTSEFIRVPEEMDDDELPKWYSDIINMIETDCKVKPNYLIRMELEEVPQEYNDKNKWNEYIKQVRAKQYGIPIHFKNELLDMDSYKSHENIDLVGFKKRENEKVLELFIHRDDLTTFHIKVEDIYVNVNTSNETDNSNNMLPWGYIQMFIVGKEYFNQQLKDYNDGLEDTTVAEDFYGVYLMINGKLTNYKPVEGNLLGQSRNAKIDNGKSCNRFRMIIVPNNEICRDHEIFNALIRTETIKALSGFLDKSPYKGIIKSSMDLYRGKKKKSKGKIKPAFHTIITGSIYIIYLGNYLWKFGCVLNCQDYSRREGEHKRNSIEMVQLFTSTKMLHDNATTFYKHDTEDPKGMEIKMDQLLAENRDKNGEKMIEMFQNNGSKSERREYFICNSTDYITQTIIPLLNQISE